MDRQELLQKIVGFQAYARGYLVRTDMKSVQTEFEDIVREIDGDCDHLRWRGTIIPLPHFSDGDSPLRGYRCPVRLQSGCTHLLSEESESAQPITEDLVPEKDEAQRDQTVAMETPNPPGGDRESENYGQGDGLAMEAMTDSTTVWSSTALDVSYNNLVLKGSHLHSLAQEVDHTPESLRLHRNTLAMELVWIQQAIASRKKYLTLRQNLQVSEH